MSNISIEKNKLLLVEGIDDKAFFEKYLEYINISDIQIIHFNGKETLQTKQEKDKNGNLITSLKNIFKANDNFEDLEHLIIQMDYDNDGNLEKAISILQSIDYACQNPPFQPFKVHSNNKNNTKISFITTPYKCISNRKEELETLCLNLIPQNNEIQHQKILFLAKDYINKVNKLHTKPTTHKIDKSVLHTYFSAFSKSSGKENNFLSSRLNENIERNCFDFNSDIMQPYKQFFENIQQTQS